MKALDKATDTASFGDEKRLINKAKRMWIRDLEMTSLRPPPHKREGA